MTDLEENVIITMLSTQEEAIAQLYAAFSKVLPESKQFWSNLVIQEKAHRDVLSSLADFRNSKQVYLNSKLFNTAALQTNIDSIKKKTESALAEGITEIRALSIAADIEHSLIETGYFKVIETKIPEIRKELDEIERHTRMHVAQVEKRLKDLKDRERSRDMEA